MLKNDRTMMILTGLVLAIFAGSMVKYGDRIMGLMSGTDVVASQDDSFSVRAGSRQVLDVLSNDTVKGQVVVLSRPDCGAIEVTSNNSISFSSDESCQGLVEFAYCVDSEGTCTPNAVKVNVISVSYAQNTNEETSSKPVHIPENNSAEIIAPPNAVDEQTAPEIENFAVEMAPPTLAAPSMSELISPSSAVASIRQSAGGLNQAANLDQNIATQNSANVAQAETAAPTVFAAPDMGESSGISLGASAPVIASNIAAPTGLQANTGTDSVLVTAEHGPVALASLQTAQPQPAQSENAPLSANPERSSFTPGKAPDAQMASAQPEQSFSATPIGTGPIALVALNPTSAGNASGESLNLVLTEPGLQSFASPASAPAALAPAAPGPQSVSILERAPEIGTAAMQPRALEGEASVGVIYTASANSNAPQSGLGKPMQALSSTQSIAGAAPQISLVPPATSGLETIQQASLETPPETQAGTAPAQSSTCNIGLNAEATRGANVSIDISAACKPNQMVTFQHSGIEFSLMTDAQGAAHTIVPAMEASADISVLFADGSQAIASVPVRDIDSVVRVGVSWASGMNLDLQAMEFGAAAGSEGQVNASSPRDYRTSRIKGGGYLVQLGDPALANGKLAEVYTIPVARGQQRGTIAMSVSLDNPSEVCGQSISAKTVRSREGQAAGIRNIRFTVPACGNLSSRMELPGALNDIRLAGR